MQPIKREYGITEASICRISNVIFFRFYRKYNFPGVIGCIDCTHIAIFPPKKDDPNTPEHLYVNRKGYHSLNVQLVSMYLMSSNKF